LFHLSHKLSTKRLVNSTWYSAGRRVINKGCAKECSSGR